MDEQPEIDAARELHAQLLQGDRGALERVAELFLHPLIQRIQSSHRAADEQWVLDAVIEAILEYVQRPQSFSSQAGRTLAGHLAMAADRNLSNALRGESRRKQREQRAAASADPVEHATPAGILLGKEEDRRRRDERAQLMQLLDDPRDREVLRLRFAGERRTEIFAAALGIANLPPDDQRSEVKRAKDRIDKLLRRGGRK